MLSSISGLYFTRISTFEPKPPAAMTTALHEMSYSSPVSILLALTPATDPSDARTRSSAFTLRQITRFFRPSARLFSATMMPLPSLPSGMIERGTE